MEFYPAIDLRNGRVVRLHQGDYAQETVYGADPLRLAQQYRDSGAQWIHVVDLDGARDGSFSNLQAIEQIVGFAGLAVQCGGGIRDQAGLDRLRAAGAQRVVIGSLAVREPNLVCQWLRDLGPEDICLALDVRQDEQGRMAVATAGWIEDSGVSLWDALLRYRDCGLRHVLCTDIGRDGTLAGPNLALYRALSESQPDLAIQASGGVARLDDLAQLRGSGVAGVVIGKALLEGRFTPAEALRCLRAA